MQGFQTCRAQPRSFLECALVASSSTRACNRLWSHDVRIVSSWRLQRNFGRAYVFACCPIHILFVPQAKLWCNLCGGMLCESYLFRFSIATWHAQSHLRVYSVQHRSCESHSEMYILEGRRCDSHSEVFFLRDIMHFRFANRGKSHSRVWMQKRDSPRPHSRV